MQTESPSVDFDRIAEALGQKLTSALVEAELLRQQMEYYKGLAEERAEIIQQISFQSAQQVIPTVQEDVE